jgi:hypothetical protein
MISSIKCARFFGPLDVLRYRQNRGMQSRRADFFARTVGVPRRVWYAPEIFFPKWLEVLVAVPSLGSGEALSSSMSSVPSSFFSLPLHPLPRGRCFRAHLYPTSGSDLRSLTHLHWRLVCVDLPVAGSKSAKHGISLYSSYVWGARVPADMISSARSGPCRLLRHVMTSPFKVLISVCICASP